MTQLLTRPPAPTLAKRYSALAGERYRPRKIDLLLRAFDVAISGIALAVFSPLLALISLSVLLTSGRPVLYRGRRVGRAGGIFTMYKFRTLKPDAETRLGPYLGEELTKRTQE